MTEVSQKTPHWTAVGLPMTVPSSLSPGAARRAVGPSYASRPARAPASSSWHGGVRPTTGRAWLAARAGAGRGPNDNSLQRLGGRGEAKQVASHLGAVQERQDHDATMRHEVLMAALRKLERRLADGGGAGRRPDPPDDDAPPRETHKYSINLVRVLD